MWIWWFLIKFLSIDNCWDFKLSDCFSLVILWRMGLFWRLFGIDIGMKVFRLVVDIFNFVVICLFFLFSNVVCVDNFVMWESKVCNLIVVCCFNVLMFFCCLLILVCVKWICVIFFDIDFVEWFDISIKIDESIVVFISVWILILCL